MDRPLIASRFYALVPLLIVPACSADPAPEILSSPSPTEFAAPASEPVGNVQTFDGGKFGIRFKFPADWKPEKAATAVFDVAAPVGKSYSALSLDVPKLPMHIPGMISAKMVADGYVDDLKKDQMKDAKVDEYTDLKVAGVAAKRVKCTGHGKDGKTTADVAICLVRNDRVYIFSCDSDKDGYPAARAALDAATASIEWTK